MSSNNGQKEIPKLNKHASLNLSSKNVGDEHIGRFKKKKKFFLF